MSELAGIFYFDFRPVSLDDQRHVERALARYSGAARIYAGPGVLIGCSTCSGALDECHSGCSLPELDNVCTFDGRLDNSKDLPGSRAGFSHRYYRQRPPTPADHALAAYEAAGPDGLRDLIGDWSLAIWDAGERSILLASDYAGVRPLYFHRTTSRLVWCSSLEHIVRWTGMEDLDEEYVADFITRGATGTRTPYRGIHPVPAGCSIRISRDRLVTARHWDYPVGEKICYWTDSEYEERMRELFQEAVSARLQTESPVCAELSGGLDSSSVVCTANQLIRAGAVRAPSLTSFTYQFPGSADEKFYRAVEAACGISSQYLDTDEYPPMTPSCPGFAEPVVWAPRFAELAHRMTSIGSRVFLTGQTGDLIMGNWLDDAEQAADLLSQGKVKLSIREAFAWSHALQIPVYSIMWRSLRPGSHRNFDRSRGAPRVFGDSLHAGFRKRMNTWDRDQSAPAWLAEAGPSLRKRLTGLSSLLDGRTLQCPEPLQAVSYSHPFAHRPLVEFMLKIPAGQVCRPGEPRRLMRRALAGIVPDVVLRRRSKSNYDAMYVRSLRPCAAELLRNIDSARLVQSGYVDKESLQFRLLRLMQGLDCDASQLRYPILLECWLRQRELRAAGLSSPMNEDSPKKGMPGYQDSDCERPAANVVSDIR